MNRVLLIFFSVPLVNIVAIGHGLLKRFRSMVIGCVLRTAGSSLRTLIYVFSLDIPDCLCTINAKICCENDLQKVRGFLPSYLRFFQRYERNQF